MHCIEIHRPNHNGLCLLSSELGWRERDGLIVCSRDAGCVTRCVIDKGVNKGVGFGDVEREKEIYFT